MEYQMDRRGFVRALTWGTALAALSGHVAGTALAASPTSTYTPGTYTACAPGRKGDVEVKTVFSDTAIKSVAVVSHSETRYISDAAIEQIPARIVETQSLAVDGVTGATFTSNAILNAVADCVVQANGDEDALRNAMPDAPASEEIALDADLIIVGAGASGMAAAVAAAQQGVKNIAVFEKTSNMGGNALVSGGYLEYIDAPSSIRGTMTDGYRSHFSSVMARGAEAGVPQDVLDAIQQEYDEYYTQGNTQVYDSEAFYAVDHFLIDGGTFDYWQWFAAMNHNLDRWLDDMDLDWMPCCGIVGCPWPRWSGVTEAPCGEGYFDLFSSQIDANDYPVSLFTCTPVTELIIENDAVVGVVAQGDNGCVYRARAPRVILATGGYSGNPAMLKEYNTHWPWDADTVIPTTNAFGHTGDGIVMAQAAGAAVDAMGTPMMFPYADCLDYSTETIVGDTGNCLLVNADGKRFIDESRTRLEIAGAIMEQPDQKVFIISDSANCLINGDTTQFGASASHLLETGHLFKADTLAELAALIDVDAEALEQTVETYNGYARDQVDAEFGRSAFTETSPIATAPFYASPRTWAAHITTGGVTVDLDTYQALRADGTPIEGLYCVGELVSGMMGIASMGCGLDCVQAMA